MGLYRFISLLKTVHLTFRYFLTTDIARIHQIVIHKDKGNFNHLLRTYWAVFAAPTTLAQKLKMAQ
ncbi:MAG: hypothetical protein ACI8XX_002092 [Polaribacter sp.]|jgi:hypothetical protein